MFENVNEMLCCWYIAQIMTDRLYFKLILETTWQLFDKQSWAGMLNCVYIVQVDRVPGDRKRTGFRAEAL